METVTVLKPTKVVDPFSGEETDESWDNPAATVVENCIVAPLESHEPTENGRSAVIAGYKVFMPYGTDVTENDRVVLYGKTWNVDGIPFAWKNPFTGNEQGVEVQLRGVIG